MKLSCNILCADIQAQMDFYQGVFGWPEREEDRSEIYRALSLPGGELGFNAQAAYALLQIGDRKPPSGPNAVTVFPTFTVETPSDVDSICARAVARGGTLVKGPYATYYGNWQAVLADPESNVFRATCLTLPDGAVAPALSGLG